MKRRFVKAALAVSLAVAALSSSRPARAQELQVTGPLKGAPAARHLRLYRKGRFEFAPTASFTLLDEYRRTLLVGARLNYFLTDWLGIGVWGAGGVWSETTTLTNEISQVAPRNVETVINVNHTGGCPGGNCSMTMPGAPPSTIGSNAWFADQTAKLSYVIAPQATFIPFRGKLAIFNKIFVDTDLSLAAGLAIVGIQERQFCGGGGQLGCYDPRTFALASQTKFTWTFGIDLNFYPSNLVSFGVEYRALPFYWNPAGFDTRGGGPNGNYPDNQVNSSDDTFKFNQIVTLAVGFSFPAPKVSE
jgi:opacity protein-like surface antigen